MTDLIKVSELAFAYEKNNLLFQHLNFALLEGEILAILGQNGCGKSTLLDLLLGIHRPLQGNIQLNNSIGFVPQFFSAPFAYSVLDIVLMGRSNHIATFSKPKLQDIEVALQALADLQLQHLAEQDFASLSGGQRQLILIARAIASECRLMLLDEPTSALDLANQDAVLSLLRQLAKKHGLGIIFTTHQPNHAQAIANKTLLINRNFIRFGQTDEILTSENLTALFHLPMIVEQSQYQQQPFSHFVPVYEVLLEGKRDE